MMVFRPSDILGFLLFIGALMIAAPIIAFVQAVWPVLVALFWLAVFLGFCWIVFDVGWKVYRKVRDHYDHWPEDQWQD